MIVECKKCGKEFKTYPSKIKNGRGKYCSKKCSMQVTNKILIENGKRTRFTKGDLPHNYKGYRYTISRKGGRKYKQIRINGKYAREHRLVMEKHIGRPLTEYEIVHHKDGDTLNNDISNLELMFKRDHDRMNTHLNIHRRWYQRAV